VYNRNIFLVYKIIENEVKKMEKTTIRVEVPIEDRDEAVEVVKIFEENERERGNLMIAFLSGYKLGQLNPRKEGQPA